MMEKFLVKFLVKSEWVKIHESKGATFKVTALKSVKNVHLEVEAEWTEILLRGFYSICSFFLLILKYRSARGGCPASDKL